MKKNLIGLGVVFSFFALSACSSTTNGNFACPHPETGMCKPIHDVDKMVSRGQYNSTTVTRVEGTSTSAAKLATNTTDGYFSTPYPASVITPGAPLRIEEQVMAVWVAPYEDKQDNYHEPSTLYVVIKPGHWAADPVKSVDGDDDHD